MTTKIDEKRNAPEELELFIQGEGLGGIRLIKADPDSTFRQIIAGLAAEAGGGFAAAMDRGQLTVMLEDSDKEVSTNISLRKAGVRSRQRMHIHRCRKVKVSVNFNGETAVDDFPPSTTVGKVKKWADRKFDIDKVDATEHALQQCGTPDRPDEDIHIGTLTNNTSCSVCFDLVPKKRVEGASR